MTQIGMAVPAALLLVSLSIPSAGQTTDDTSTTASSFVAPVQSPVQVTAPSLPGQKQLSAEELADILMARKDYREAAFSYKRLVDENPRNAIYWNKLGIALHQQSELSSALKSYQQAVKVNPQYADAQNNIGTIWYQRKKYNKAIRAYERAIKLRSDMAVLYSNLGYAYFGKGNTKTRFMRSGRHWPSIRSCSSTPHRAPAPCCRTVRSATVEDFTSCLPSRLPKPAILTAV